MSIYEKILNIDRRWIYLLGWIVVMIPIINPIGLPITIGQYSQKWYNAIEDMPEDSVLLVSVDHSLAAIPEVYPMDIATFHHLWSHDFKIVVIAVQQDGVLAFNMLLDEMKPDINYGKVYGEDWIVLGWVPQGEAGMASLGSDVWSTKPIDYLEGKSVSQFPIMQNIKTGEDFDVLITINSGTPGLPEWLRQWQTPYGITVLSGCVAISFPGQSPYMQSGQVKAVLAGIPATAEYESLLNHPGTAIAGVDAISTSHMLVLSVVIVGNIIFFLTKIGGKKQ